MEFLLGFTLSKIEHVWCVYLLSALMLLAFWRVIWLLFWFVGIMFFILKCVYNVSNFYIHFCSFFIKQQNKFYQANKDQTYWKKSRYAGKQEDRNHRRHIHDDPDGDDRRPSYGASKHHCIASCPFFAGELGLVQQW